MVAQPSVDLGYRPYEERPLAGGSASLAAAVGVDPTSVGFKGPPPRRWCRVKLDLRAGAAPALPG